jgi:integrase/recombinase XerC
MRLSEAQARYVRWLLATRDLSPHTVRAYEGDLSSFERHLGADVDVVQLGRDDLVEFLERQKESGLSPASVKRRASALRGFCRWMMSQDLLAADPWAGASISLGRIPKLPRVLPAHELALLLRRLRVAAGVTGGQKVIPETVRQRPHESTTFLAVSLMVTTGVRVHEVVGFRCQDIDVPGRAMRLVGKGRRERQVYLTNNWIASFTDAYIRARDAFGISHSRLLFNTYYEPLSTRAIRSRLTKAATTAGLSTHVTPHMLRHTAATQLLEAGVDIRYIQRLLGHASLGTTEIYTHISDRALRRVVSDADVLGRFVQAQ